MSCLLHLDLPTEEFEASLLGHGVNVVRGALSWRPRSCFPAWPDQRHSDISSALDVLEGELREDAADPVRCMRPAGQWPFCPPREFKLPTPFTERGVKLPRKLSGEKLWVQSTKGSILPDAGQRRAMNGAVGIQKLRPQADGSVVTRQRFISLLVSSSACLRPLRSDAGLLPMVF